ncbi:Maf family protein [Finegoldia magna]|uniref:dTTP/UTP pyrophosphatase n=1 Tax=Finegoldia magna ATCC 53516 TaxID=525282 RepID=D6S7P2_FINMA|nr:Maf family protein [Finegoldia magna]EFH94096.1 Maf-like protein [Finegoldia magna ATCC 53516]
MKYVKNVTKIGKLGKFNNVILVSKSPRRNELLKNICDFESISTDIDERKIEELAYEKYKDRDLLEKLALVCCEISKSKILPLELKENTLYISSDTIVINDGKILNKPKDYDEALDMLTSYLGKVHKVVTSVCLKSKNYEEIFYTFSNVKFSEKTDKNIQLLKDYIDEGTVYDKAGAYGIQDLNPVLIEYIEGDLNTIIGLPVSEINKRISDK